MYLYDVLNIYSDILLDIDIDIDDLTDIAGIKNVHNMYHSIYLVIIQF